MRDVRLARLRNGEYSFEQKEAKEAKGRRDSASALSPLDCGCHVHSKVGSSAQTRSSYLGSSELERGICSRPLARFNSTWSAVDSLRRNSLFPLLSPVQIVFAFSLLPLLPSVQSVFVFSARSYQWIRATCLLRAVLNFFRRSVFRIWNFTPWLTRCVWESR